MQRFAMFVLLTMFALFAGACTHDEKTVVGSVTVDYSKTLDEMIAAGSYDSTNSDINTVHFPVKGKGAVPINLEIVHFNNAELRTSEVEDRLDRMAYRTATLPELLAFGAKHPELRRQFSIIALGSSWFDDDVRHVPYLDEHGGERKLSLIWTISGSRWSGHYRFLVVRK